MGAFLTILAVNAPGWLLPGSNPESSACVRST